MGNRFPVIVLILLGALVLSPPRSAEAGQFKISPVRLYLGADRPSDVLRVSNRGVEPLLLHLNVQAWDHPAGRDRFQDTRDVLLNPMIFELAPGQQRLVRIGLMRPSGVEHEQAYRLFIREVPQLVRRKRRQIDTVLHVSMPVFRGPGGVQRARTGLAPRTDWRDGARPLGGKPRRAARRGLVDHLARIGRRTVFGHRPPDLCLAGPIAAFGGPKEFGGSGWSTHPDR